tara:strand:+ start:794 stop:1690 length:897 start_codon:yes stop_codon:yes gene_type:complete
MALVTFCPSCGTTFRVQSSQLQAHNGDIRCGQCDQIFNGFAALITVKESEIEYPSKETETPLSESNREAAPQHGSSASGLNDEKDLSLSAYLIQKEGEVEGETKEAEETEEAPEIEVAPETGETEKPGESYNFDALHSREPQRLWGGGSLFLLLVLVGQISYLYRTELTVIAPEVKPYIEQFCVMLSCTVPLPQNLSLLSIESSDLQMNPEREPEVITLVATVHNHASYPQALPAFKLTLTGIKGQSLASRIFTAEDYLTEQVDIVQFIEPNHEINIRLYLDGAELSATGYQLALLYL